MILALLVGGCLLRPAGRDAVSPFGLALALVFGTTLLVGIGFPLARLGAPVTPGAIAGLAGLLAAALLLLGRRGPRFQITAPQTGAPGDLASRLGGLLTLAALAIFLVKLGFAPVWTWDHFAVWGVKSRRMVVDGGLDLGFLDLSIFRTMEPHYPLGLPFAWRLLGLGAMPGDLAFKVCHALFGLALVAVTRQGLLLASGSRRIAAGLTAWLAVSPVLWDTIGLGHADLPLGLWAVTALVLVLGELERGIPGRGLVLAGIAAGFLPGIKQEGLIVALAVLAASSLLIWRSALPERPRRLLALLLPASLTLAASRLLANVAQTHGVNFFAGSWWVRAAVRVPHADLLVKNAAEFLLAPDWLGIWIAFGFACLLVAARRELRRGRAAILCGLVVALLAVYVAVYFVTVLNPLDHLRGSFFRLLCPLAPVALLAMAALCRAPVSREEPAVTVGPGGSGIGASWGLAEPAGSAPSRSQPSSRS